MWREYSEQKCPACSEAQDEIDGGHKNNEKPEGKIIRSSSKNTSTTEEDSKQSDGIKVKGKETEEVNKDGGQKKDDPSLLQVLYAGDGCCSICFDPINQTEAATLPCNV